MVEEKKIKSAYELALERLGDSGGASPVSEEKKRELQDIDRDTEAKVAEQEILFKSRIQAALLAEKHEDAIKLREEMTTELRRLRERGEAKKEEARRQGEKGGTS